MKFSVSLMAVALLAGVAHGDVLAKYLDGSYSLEAVRTDDRISAGAITTLPDTSSSLESGLGMAWFWPVGNGAHWLTVTPEKQLEPGLTSPDSQSHFLSLAAAQGSTMNLSSVSMSMSAAYNYQTRFNPDGMTFGVALWYEDEGGTWQKIGEHFQTNYSPGFLFPEQISFDLTGIGALQNVSGAKFAFSALSNTADPTGNLLAVCFSDITVEGSFSGGSIPEPGTTALGLAGLAIAFMRKRRQ